jgi:transglutaminase-like putative cysteine protease
VTTPPNRQTSLERDVAATVAVTIYSLTVAAGMARVFSGWEFMSDLGLLVVVGHGTSLLLRRLKVSGWIAIPFITVALLWVLLALHYGHTMTGLLPRRATFDLVDLEVGLVRDQFQTAVAPVLYGAGWATLAGFAMIIAVVMADSFAFRAEARGEALVPGGVLFIFISALGSQRLRIEVTAALLAAGVITVVALRALHDRTRRVELTTSRRSGSMLVPAALGTAAAIAVMAGLVGPRIPGAGAEPIYETRGRNGGVTEVQSPLVDIRSRLTNRGNVELFRVNADAESYWRETTLPEFDGDTFRLPNGELESIQDEGRPAANDGVIIRQQIQILALDGPLVPAAASVRFAGGSRGQQQIDLRLNEVTNTLLASGDFEPGDLFAVDSVSPRLTPDQLRAATTAAPPGDVFIDLPDDLPDVVGELAAEATSGATTSFDRAIALEQWFHANFEYSLEVQQGHGSSAIESFLNGRVGYCEQFAATFAVMARTLDIPSRVAVGYTPGLLNADGWYSVIGKNSHAWPELWFDGIGWVAFEPTPGRGAPGNESYTGRPAQQDTTGPDAAAGDPVGSSPRPTTPSTVVAPPNNGAAPTTFPSQRPRILDPEGRTGSGSASDNSSGFPWPQVLVMAILAAGIAAPWVGRRWRARQARSHGPADRVLRAWVTATMAAQQAGVNGHQSMTTREWAAATAGQLPVAARPMRALAEVVDRVTFARAGTIDLDRPGTFGSSMTHDCELWSQQIRRIASDTLNNRQRIRRYLTDWR